MTPSVRRVILIGLVACWPLLTAGSCATTSATEHNVEIRTVGIPIPVRCAADPGADPVFSDTPSAIQAAADIFERVRLLLAGRAQRDARLVELKASTAGCQ